MPETKHIWIIGASSGIGYELAKVLDSAGHTLYLSARREDKLTELNQQLGNRHSVHPVDVTDYQSIKHTVEIIQTKTNRVDSVIFMAGIYTPGKLMDIDNQQALNIINVNLAGAINVCQAILPVLQQQAHGQLVLCSSVAGYCGLPSSQPYSATKSALNNLAESLYIEHKKTNIDIKLICPGFVRTPLTDQNTFKMPMMIEANEAAAAIAKGIQSNKFEIHFPKRFTYLMKLLASLPYWIYLRIVG